MSDNPISDMIESLEAFAKCEHKRWKCTVCGCVTDTGAVASAYRNRVNELEQQLAAAQTRIAELEAECANLKARQFPTIADIRAHERKAKWKPYTEGNG